MSYIDKKVDEFDPNNIETDPYATYCPARTPAFKLHRQKGHGTSALMQHGGGALYHKQHGTWQELVRVRDQQPTRCDACGAPTLRHIPAQRYGRACDVNDIRAKFLRDPRNGKLVDPLQVWYVCPNCVSHDPRF